jgi:hypothetical protein
MTTEAAELAELVGAQREIIRQLETLRERKPAAAAANGGDADEESIRQLIARIDAETEAEDKSELARHQRALEQKLDTLNARLAVLTRPAPERRSQMSPRRKSEISGNSDSRCTIGIHGDVSVALADPAAGRRPAGRGIARPMGRYGAPGDDRP